MAENLFFKFGKYWKPLRKVGCYTCEKEFTLYKAYRKFKGEYLPVQYTPRCPDCQTVYHSPFTLSLKSKTMKKTQKIKSKLKPKRVLKTKKSTALTLKQKNTPAYYNCLLNQAKSGFKGKITKACRECKTNAPALNLAYKKEAQKLVGAYKQLGISLSKILSH